MQTPAVNEVGEPIYCGFCSSVNLDGPRYSNEVAETTVHCDGCTVFFGACKRHRKYAADYVRQHERECKKDNLPQRRLRRYKERD